MTIPTNIISETDKAKVDDLLEDAARFFGGVSDVDSISETGAKIVEGCQKLAEAIRVLKAGL